MFRILVISFLFVLLCSLWQKAACQASYNDIKWEQIPQKKVRKYIIEQQERAQISFLADLKATCQDSNSLMDLFSYKKSYRVKANKNNVWETYKQSNPTAAWTNRKSACALVYERSSDHVHYADEEINGIEAGQVLFMDLKLMKGLVHLATAFEITKVEDEVGVIEINYTEAGINRGKQIIKMHEAPDGSTIIEHSSMISSGRKFRDRVLYPYFHNRLINTFHRKMRQRVIEGSLVYTKQ